MARPKQLWILRWVGSEPNAAFVTKGWRTDQRHAWPTPTPFGQDWQNTAETFHKSRAKTSRGSCHNGPLPKPRFFFISSSTRADWAAAIGNRVVRMKKKLQDSHENNGNHGRGVFAWGGKVCGKAQMATKRTLCQRKPWVNWKKLEKRIYNPVEQEDNRKNSYVGRGQETILEMSVKDDNVAQSDLFNNPRVRLAPLFPYKRKYRHQKGIMNRSLRSAVLAALLCVIHLLLASPTALQAQATDYICSINPDNTLNIEYYIGAGGMVTVPSSINNTNVTTIGDGAFEYATVTSVIIPAGIASIGAQAFYYCYSLTSITVSNGVSSIGNQAFRYCTSLQNITIPVSVTNVGQQVFSGCTSLTAINVKAGNPDYSSVSGVLFDGGQNTLLFYPPGLSGAYTVPTNVKSIGGFAFDNLPNLTGITIPNTVTNIGSNAFDYCYGLHNITIPGSVQSIGDSAFYNCTSLTNAALSTGLTSIGASTFSYSTLRTLTLPASILSIGPNAFDACTVLTGVSLPATLTNIGSGAFEQCTRLTSVTMASGLTIISSFEFELDTSLGSVSIPGSVTNIGQGAFIECSALTNATLASGVAAIGGTAFAYSGLTTVTIPDSVTNVGSLAFLKCPNLTAINVNTANTNYSSLDGVLFDKGRDSLIQYPGGLSGAYTVPGTVTAIEGSAFYDCTGLTTIIIPGSVNSIGSYAFYGCTGLVSAGLSNGLLNINTYAFDECTGLASVTIPASVTNLGAFAFQTCSSLTNVVINNGLTSLGEYAFSVCGSLLSVTIPASVTNLGPYEFAACYALTSVYFQGSAPGVDSSVFSGDTGAVAYYLSGTSGWATFAADANITIQPLTSNTPPQLTGVGVQGNGFGFTFTGTNNQVIVVEASIDPARAGWQPVLTNMLTGTSFNFTDPQWTNYPARFYRVLLTQ